PDVVPGDEVGVIGPLPSLDIPLEVREDDGIIVPGGGGQVGAGEEAADEG
ncbi:unnamed protein product, partial [marine sediment metagenome]